MELYDVVVTVLIGIGIGFGMVVIYAWYLWRNLKSRVDQMIKEVIEEAEASMVGLDIEIDNGTYFCYNSEDKQFICQGATASEIRRAFSERYPGKTAYLAGGDPALIERIKAELAELNNNE